MVEIKLNGERKRVEAVDVLGLLHELGVSPVVGGLAVALNEVVIPRGQWATTSLKDGDEVELVRATAGG
jgi:sulfur carrier protein